MLDLETAKLIKIKAIKYGLKQNELMKMCDCKNKSMFSQILHCRCTNLRIEKILKEWVGKE